MGRARPRPTEFKFDGPGRPNPGPAHQRRPMTYALIFSILNLGEEFGVRVELLYVVREVWTIFVILEEALFHRIYLVLY